MITEAHDLSKLRGEIQQQAHTFIHSFLRWLQQLVHLVDLKQAAWSTFLHPMGCISSKLKPDDIVGRCKARKSFMKQAVMHRHSFATAHSAYLLALRNTGAALRQFAEGEGGLPAKGQGPYATLPEPPPPPPFPTPGTLSENSPASSSMHKARKKDDQSTPISMSASASPAKAWDFFDPFQPADPPLHLQEHRRMMSMQEQAQDSNTTLPSPRDPARDAPEKPDAEGNIEEVVKVETNVQVEHGESGDDMTSNGHVKEERREGDVVDVGEKEGDGLDENLPAIIRLGATKDLIEIVKELDEEFLKASASGGQVSQVLEAGIKGQYETDSSIMSKFQKYDSARVFNAFSWNWSRNPLSRKEEAYLYTDQSDRSPNHAMTLERVLAWEKKLYDEVKTVENLRVEREKKCALLKRLEMKNEDADAIEKIRAEIKRLHSLMMISYQGVESNIEAIEDLRDDELHPQLVALTEGLKDMWLRLHRCHAKQSQIIIHIKSLDVLVTKEHINDMHHQATIQLERELFSWHQSFCKLIASQRAYMDAIHGWLKLSLMFIPTGKEKNGESRGEPEVYRLCEEWQRALSCLPDKVASEALKSFSEVVKAMVGKQVEEMKQRRKVEKLERQWQKKAKGLEPVDEEEQERDGGRGSSNIVAAMSMPIGPVNRTEALAAMRSRIESEMMKHWKIVQDTRVFTMNNLQTGLPAVFEAMTGFSALSSQAFQQLWSLTRFIPSLT